MSQDRREAGKNRRIEKSRMIYGQQKQIAMDTIMDLVAEAGEVKLQAIRVRLAELGIAPPTMYRALDDLEEKEWIVRIRTEDGYRAVELGR